MVQTSSRLLCVWDAECTCIWVCTYTGLQRPGLGQKSPHSVSALYISRYSHLKLTWLDTLATPPHLLFLYVLLSWALLGHDMSARDLNIGLHAYASALPTEPFPESCLLSSWFLLYKRTNFSFSKFYLWTAADIDMMMSKVIVAKMERLLYIRHIFRKYFHVFPNWIPTIFWTKILIILILQVRKWRLRKTRFLQRERERQFGFRLQPMHFTTYQWSSWH